MSINLDFHKKLTEDFKKIIDAELHKIITYKIPVNVKRAEKTDSNRKIIEAIRDILKDNNYHYIRSYWGNDKHSNTISITIVCNTEIDSNYIEILIDLLKKPLLANKLDINLLKGKTPAYKSIYSGATKQLEIIKK
jgi:hypothetical protein